MKHIVLPTRFLLLIVCAWTGLNAPVLANTGGDTTCAETSERELEPYLLKVQKGEAALASYGEQNAAHRKWLEEKLAKYREVQVLLAEHARGVLATLDNRIRWGGEAIAELDKKTRARVAALRAEAAKKRAAGDAAGAAKLEEQAGALERDKNSGRQMYFKGEVNSNKNRAGWVKYVKGQEEARSKFKDAFDAGAIPIFHGGLNERLTWQEALLKIAGLEKDVNDSVERKPTFFLGPINAKETGATIDERVAAARAALENIRDQIQAGSYALFVPALNETRDRNGVQDLVAQAKQGIRDLRKEWTTRTFWTFNPAKNDRLTNGELDTLIAAKAQELADFRALGDAAVMFVIAAEGRVSGELCKQKQRAAATAQDEKGRAYWGSRYVAWQEVAKQHIEKLVEAQVLLEGFLEEHERLYKAEVKALQDDIDTRLTLALAQTPCGGSASVEHDPKSKTVGEHLGKLDALSESEKETQQRRTDYGDKVYVEADSTVHGEPRDAWANALRDTEMRVPSTLEAGAGAMRMMKDLADWLGGFKELKELQQASAKIGEFIQAVEGLDPRSADFFKQRRALRKDFFSGMEELVSTGLLSERKINQLLSALKASGSGSMQASQMRRRLIALRTYASSLRQYSLPRMKAALSAGEGLGEALATRYRSVASQSLSQFAGGLAAEGRQLSTAAQASWKQMSKFDRGILALSIASAAAEVVESTQQGTALSEAVARSAVNLAIDFAIAGFPISAAAEMGTQVLFTSYAVATGEAGVADATLSNTSKWVAEQVLNGVAFSAASMGHGWTIATRHLAGEPGIAEVLAGVSLRSLRNSLSHVEDQLDALAPGDPGEQRLMRMRQSFRELMRLKLSKG